MQRRSINLPREPARRRSSAIAAATALLVHVSPAPAAAQGFFSQFRDADGWVDVSDYVLDNAAGILPVPIAITEPAIGAGIGAAALFFKPPEDYATEADADAASEADEFVLPDVSAVAAAATENGTWFLGGGHFAYFRDDRIRYEGVMGLGKIVLKFYGLDGEQSAFDQGFGFEAETIFLQQPIQFRIRESHWFAGVEYDYGKIRTTFDLSEILPILPPLELDVTVSGLRASIAYENLDTQFTPSQGIDFKLDLGRDSRSLGSDFDFRTARSRIFFYANPMPNWVLGVRAAAERLSGDAPFFVFPYIDLRGIPALRYQDNAVALIEVEARWAFHTRLSLVGFTGAGKAADSFSGIGKSASRVTRGLGIRYFVARKLGMHAGLDVAKGPEDTHYYLTFGSAWR